MPIDDDLPPEAQDGSSAAPFDADGVQLGDEPDGPADTPISPDADVEEQEDGSAIVTLAKSENEDARATTDFYDNLATKFDEVMLRSRARRILEAIERDKTARKDRDEQQAEGIKRTGMGGEAPGGADFEGASKAVHPVLVEGCIDFAARAMKEIMPPSGPCKTQIIGKSTPEKLDRAERKREFMNWQLTRKINGYRDQTKKMLTQLPLGGSQYKHWWYDHDLGKPDQEFVSIDNVILPAGAQDFYSAQRITIQQDMTEETFLKRVDSGYYKDIDNYASINPEQTASAKATDKVEGVEQDPYNQDGLRRVFIVNTSYDAFDEDDVTGGDPAPYMWHIDETTGKVAALYRNWEEDDDKFERMHWLVDYTFIHWRGPQGVGLLHVIGSLSGALTGGIRAILDGALAQTAMSGIKLKGGRNAGTNESPAIGEITELEGPTAGDVDDIRKLFMPYPFNPVSPVLMQIVEWLTEQARGVVQTANEKLADGKTDMPVGSTLALIEEGSQVFSDIHAGLHHSQEQELKILHRLNKWYLKDKETIAELGDLIVSRKDFEGPCDIIPVSDPRIFSETQRYAQIQAIWQLAMNPNPQVASKFNIDRLLERTMQLLHADSWDDIIKVAPEAEDLDPVSENMMVALGEQPIKAFEFQDHMAHLKVHLHFATSPMFGANPLFGPKVVNPLVQHCMEHMVYAYVTHSVAAAHVAHAMGQGGESADAKYAAVTSMVDRQLAQEFQQLGQMFKMAMQLAQQFAPKPPMDPQAQVQMQLGMQELQMKDKHFQGEMQLKQHQLASDHTTKMAQIQQTGQQAQQADQSRLQFDQITQSQKDQREQQAQAQEDQREREKLQAEQQREAAKLENDRVIESMRQHHENSRHHFETVMGTVNEHIKNSAEATQKLAEGGSAKKDLVVQDPEHTAAIGKLTEALSKLPQAQLGQPDPHEENRKAMTELATMLQQGHHNTAGMLNDGMVQMGRAIAAGLERMGTQIAQGQQRVLDGIEDLHDSNTEMHAASGGHVSDLRDSMRELHKAVSAPRIRTLSRDPKTGAKRAIDRLARDGEV